MRPLVMLIVMRVAVMFWLIVADIIFCNSYKKKSHFALRASLSIIGSLGVTALLGYLGCLIQIAIFDTGYIDTIVYDVINLVIHIMIFGINIIGLFICFDETWGTILFGNTAAYATQNIGNMITNILSAIWPQTNLMSTEPITAVNFFPWLLSYVITDLIIYFVFAKSIKKTRDITASNSIATTILFAVTIIVAIVVRSITSQFAAAHPRLFSAMGVCNIFCCLTVLFAQFLIGSNIAAKKENEAIKHMSYLKMKQYEFTKENIDIINIKCHDLKHQILQLKSGGNVDSNYIKQLSDSISFYDSVVKTGCEPLDVILTDKNMYCTKNQVQLSIIADGAKLNFMEVSDIYSLFGNLLENAIEYVTSLPVDKRIIKLAITSVGNLLNINVKNYFEEGAKVKFVDGLPQTTKGSTAVHGYGLKSIRAIALKYGGSFQVLVQDHQFIVSLLIPVKTTLEPAS